LENDYSQIQITVNGINSTVSGLDDRLSEIEQSPGGLTLSAVYEGLRVAGIDITSSEEGEGSVKIYADQVTIQDGSSNNVLWVEDNTAKISNVEVVGGKIAGFKISGNDLTNEGFNNNAGIILRNDTVKTFVGIG
jgi:hypothetical protein